jgi:Flagellar biosynthesis protein, FliO
MSSTSDLLMLARVTGSLVVVLIVAAVAARLARRAGGRGGRGGLAVRERVGLTRDTSAVVLEVGERLLLLGVSAQQVSLLADLTGSPGDPSGDSRVALPGGPATLRPAGLSAGLSAGQVPRQPTAADRLSGVRVISTAAPARPLTRREIREAVGRRRPATPPAARGTGSALDPRTWHQGLEALRDLTARRG